MVPKDSRDEHPPLPRPLPSPCASSPSPSFACAFAAEASAINCSQSAWNWICAGVGPATYGCACGDSDAGDGLDFAADKPVSCPVGQMLWPGRSAILHGKACRPQTPGMRTIEPGRAKGVKQWISSLDTFRNLALPVPVKAEGHNRGHSEPRQHPSFGSLGPCLGQMSKSCRIVSRGRLQ